MYAFHIQVLPLHSDESVSVLSISSDVVQFDCIAAHFLKSDSFLCFKSHCIVIPIDENAFFIGIHFLIIR